jgi:hypothetical protein
LFCALSIKANARPACLDTIPFWSFTYNYVVFLSGHVNQQQTETREIIVENGTPLPLVLHFNYDSGAPKNARLTIKEGGKILKVLRYEQKEGPFVEAGFSSHFIIPVRGIVNLKTKNGRWEIDFFYSDKNGQNNLKLGTIVFRT